MQFNFRVTHLYDNPLDPRCSAYPGEDVRLVRLSPVDGEHVAAVGDVVVVMKAADAANLKVEQAEVTVVNPTDPSKTLVAQPAVGGTVAVLTIG